MEFCKWQEVTLAGQVLLSVYILLDSLFLVLPCCCLHTLAVTVLRVKEWRKETPGVPLVLIGHTPTHTERGRGGLVNCEKDHCWFRF